MSSDVIAAGQGVEIERLRGEVARMRPIVEAATDPSAVSLLRWAESDAYDRDEREAAGRLLSAIEGTATEAPHAE